MALHNRLGLSIALGISAAALPSAEARPLQIIHTNDLHSQIEHAQDPRFGSYAAVKAKIDELKARAQAQGIETLVLDAGDFSEGSQFYFAGRAQPIWKLFNEMGYDAAVIGNHDWLMGSASLDRTVSDVKPSFAFLGANFMFTPAHEGLKKYLKPAFETTRAGARIAVLGLTTDEFFYNWAAADGDISSPEKKAQQLIPDLRSRNDFVIALTHLGVSRDQKVVFANEGIDLVVGGHSHTFLNTPVMQLDRSGKPVPIVQAGAHGEVVGDLLVDLEPGKPLKILRYQLERVASAGPKDAQMQADVRQVRAQLEQEYGSSWLRETVARAAVPLVKQTAEPTVWSRLSADAMREATHADIAFDIPQFQGHDQPAGPVTREQIIELFPRQFDLSRKFGWTVWTVSVRGLILDETLSRTLGTNLPFTVSGVTYRIETKPNGDRVVKDIKINGKGISWYRNYRIAVPEGIGRGRAEIISFKKLIEKVITNPKDTNISLWSAIERKMRALGTISRETMPPRFGEIGGPGGPESD
jgi:5'-nucleotidase/UDP-sugar diphosphatase